MNRTLTFLVVLALALAGLYVWWQRNATRVITEQIREQAQSFFVNTADIEISNDPISLTGLHTARVPKLVIKGRNLALKNGGTLADVKIVLYNVDIDGPPFRFAAVGEDSNFYFTVTDDAVTKYIHTRGINIGKVLKIPTETISVEFTRANTMVRGIISLPLDIKVPVTAYGKVMPSSKVGKVDFSGQGLLFTPKMGVTRPLVTDTIAVINPIIDISDWPVLSEITRVKTDKHTLTVGGTIVGIRN